MFKHYIGVPGFSSFYPKKIKLKRQGNKCLSMWQY